MVRALDCTARRIKTVAPVSPGLHEHPYTKRDKKHHRCDGRDGCSEKFCRCQTGQCGGGRDNEGDYRDPKINHNADFDAANTVGDPCSKVIDVIRQSNRYCIPEMMNHSS